MTAARVVSCGASGTNEKVAEWVTLDPGDEPSRGASLAMLGGAGANALGAMLGLNSVGKLTGRGSWSAIGVLAGLTLLGETRSLGELIERTPVLRELDALGRQP